MRTAIIIGIGIGVLMALRSWRRGTLATPTHIPGEAGTTLEFADIEPYAQTDWTAVDGALIDMGLPPLG